MKMAKMESAIRTVIDFNKAFNCRDVTAMLALVTDDCVFGNPDPRAEAARYEGKDELARFWNRFFRANPQAHMEIEEMFGFSIHGVMRWRFEPGDTPDPGQLMHGVDLFLVKNALICEKLTYVQK